MKNLELKFVGIDSWHRPIFKDELNNFYGDTDQLFSHGDTEEKVLKEINKKNITYFGSRFDCEPMGTKLNENENIIFIKDL